MVIDKMDKYTWKASITKCPHCDNVISAIGTSKVNERCAVTDVYFAIQDHITSSCPLRHTIKNRKKLKTYVSIMTTTIKDKYSCSEWATNKILV
jgi:hypothetical protein